MAVIERLDFLGVPTQDPERSRAFYRGVLGLRPDEHAEWEQWAGDTCFVIWEPEKQGMPFVAQKGKPWPLRCDDVAEMRAVFEAKGVQFFGDTFDTGVCRMAISAPPIAVAGHQRIVECVGPVLQLEVGTAVTPAGRRKSASQSTRCCGQADGVEGRLSQEDHGVDDHRPGHPGRPVSDAELRGGVGGSGLACSRECNY